MKARDFVNQLQHTPIVTAITEAEQKTSGEIRVFISRREPGNIVEAAQYTFLRLGMDKSKERNSVLIYLAPRVKKFAVIGDEGVHQHCGDNFWNEVAREISGFMRKGEFTEGILHGVRRAGKLLTDHFPRHPGDKHPRAEVDHD